MNQVEMQLPGPFRSGCQLPCVYARRGSGLGVGAPLSYMGKGLQPVCAALASGLEAGAFLWWWTFHSILGGLAFPGLFPQGMLPAAS